MSERMNELFTLTQKAQKMELINEEIALKLYIEIFENYTPKISKTYESAIRLLEKRHRYSEALSICERAIDLIKQQEVSGTVDRFEATQQRLLRKIKELEPEVTTPVKKAFKLKPQHMIVSLVILGVLFAIIRFATPYGDLDVNLEGKDSLEGGESLYKETTDKEEITFPITERMIEIATNELLKNNDAKAADVIPQDQTLGIAIIVTVGTDADRSKALAEIYLKALAGAAAAEYDALKAPSGDSLGALYDYYELVISVGTSTAVEDLIAKGTKVRAASAIYWR